MTASQLGEALGLHPRGTFDFFEREGDGPGGLYGNTPGAAAFRVKANPTYIGGMLEMLNANEEQLGGFLHAMSDFQAGNFAALAAAFDFSRFKTVCDVGGALGLLACKIAAEHPALSLQSFDLPPVGPHAELAIAAAGLSERIKVVSGDFFKDPLPSADVITMGNVLHDWNLEKKQQLIQCAYAALPKGGALIVIENLIDDARRQNAFGLPMSLNMLIETGDGFDDTTADFREWCTAAGFERFEPLPLTGPTSAAVAYK